MFILCDLVEVCSIVPIYSNRVEYVLLAIGYTGLLLEVLIGSITLLIFQR